MNAVLTAREDQVLHLIASGLDSREISAVIGCAPSTAKGLVARLLRKLGADNRAHGVTLAYRLGVLDLDRCVA